MGIKFVTYVRKGNKNGAGFFYLPKDKVTTNLFRLGERIKITLSNNTYFFGKISKRHKAFGIYIPKAIMFKNNLLNQKIKVHISKIYGFYSKIGSDGRIYIPKEIAKNLGIKENDIILIRGIEENGPLKEKYSKITARKKKNRTEYMCIFDKNLYNKKIIFNIEKKIKDKYKDEPSFIPLSKFLKNVSYIATGKESIIIFSGNKTPATINSRLKYSDIALYLGAYFSDGIKKGNSWGVCASTFKQARCYLKKHKLLIKDSKPKFIISFTNIKRTNFNEAKEALTTKWKNKADIKVTKFRIRKPTGEIFSKCNKYGTLIIREHRQILLDFYNFLLQSLIREILSKKNKELAINFICGVMEGDGCVAAKKRGHIIIATNKNEFPILDSILKTIKIKFKIIKGGENRYFIRIGALEVLRNFDDFKNKIFRLYPKRRKMLFERLITVGATKFLVGGYKPCPWVKKWLNSNNFCNNNYKITKKGIKLRDSLLNEIKSVTVE